MEDEHKELIDEINEKKALSPELEEKLINAFKAFKAQ